MDEDPEKIIKIIPKDIEESKKSIEVSEEVEATSEEKSNEYSSYRMKNDVSSPSRSIFAVGKRQEMTEDEIKRAAEIAKSHLAESIRWLTDKTHSGERLEHYDPTTDPLPPSIARAIRRQTTSPFPTNQTSTVKE
jgi:hypothetical protein